jgi:hypothetical protein
MCLGVWKDISSKKLMREAILALSRNPTVLSRPASSSQDPAMEVKAFYLPRE